MVDHFQDCEFWLPPHFLNDDDFNKDASDFFSGTNSEMDSPGDSVVSSTESDTDEDGSTLGENNKIWRLSSSPNSPLWDTAGEFDHRKMVQESAGVLPSKNEQFVPMEQPGLDGCFPKSYPPQLCYQQLQLQAMRFEQYRRNQMNPTQQNRGVKNAEKMPMGLPVSAWPPLPRSQPKHQPQAQPGAGMTAVFLGNNHGAGKKPCSGTGVFLPRTVSSTGNHKNKPAYTPVFIPDRVVKALNLNLETFGVQNQAHIHPVYYNNKGASADYGAALRYINKNKKNHETVPETQSIAKEVEEEEEEEEEAEAEAENSEVIQLPPEWTY